MKECKWETIMFISFYLFVVTYEQSLKAKGKNAIVYISCF